jgi:hypothetical protein
VDLDFSNESETSWSEENSPRSSIGLSNEDKLELLLQEIRETEENYVNDLNFLTKVSQSLNLIYFRTIMSLYKICSVKMR